MGDYTVHTTIIHDMKFLLAVIALSALCLAAASPADDVVPETEMTSHHDHGCDKCMEEFQEKEGCEHWKAVAAGKMHRLHKLMAAIPKGCMRCKEYAHGECNGNCDKCVKKFDSHHGCQKWGRFVHAQKELMAAIPHESCMRCAQEAEHACQHKIVFPAFVQQKKMMACGKCVHKFVKADGCRKYGEMAQAEETVKDAVPDGCARCKEDAAKLCMGKKMSLFTQIWQK